MNDWNANETLVLLSLLMAFAMGTCAGSMVLLSDPVFTVDDVSE